ncbi:hypothetical protein Vadar_029017 [Vaccinium darrowii]|uniref:Uncharacterized protein n=1 Tax=Vaccinium darrowii TaxID=229202 RepID=A0ACB7ZNH7_9ERIC|nr:hypothetical protein Vadar_029017 [Vaccinium darrowii]
MEGALVASNGIQTQIWWSLKPYLGWLYVKVVEGTAHLQYKLQHPNSNSPTQVSDLDSNTWQRNNQV